MSAFTPAQQDELANLIARGVQSSPEAVLVRQLQGGAAASPFPAGKRSGLEVVTVTWAGGVTLSSFATVTHDFGGGAYMLALPQDQNSSGGSFVVVAANNADSFAVAAQTAGFNPPANTTREIAVLYWEK